MNATDFKSNKPMTLLLLGDPGSGKTNLAMELDRPGFIDWGDSNLQSAVDRHVGKPFTWFDVSLDASGKPNTEEDRWTRGSELLKELGKDDNVGTIVDDSLTMLQKALCYHIINKGSAAESALVIGGVKVMTRSMWSAFEDLLTKRIIQAKMFRKPYVLISHVKVDADEMNAVKLYRPSLSGKMDGTIGGLFSDVWSCETDPNMNDKVKYPTGVKYFVRTAPTTRMKLKCSCGLPAEFEFTWEAFQAHLVKRAAAQAGQLAPTQK